MMNKMQFVINRLKVQIGEDKSLGSPGLRDRYVAEVVERTKKGAVADPNHWDTLDDLLEP
jgi:hypothetical protein